jgi:hypothetical protein
MDEYVKMSIDSRKNAINSMYDLHKEDVDKVNNLFERIEEFGKSCSSATDFENIFATSELNTEYISVFTDIATKYQMKPQNQEIVNAKTATEEIAEDIKEEAEYLMDTTTQPFRAKANQEMTNQMRSMPIIGDIMYASQLKDMGDKIKYKTTGEQD